MKVVRFLSLLLITVLVSACSTYNMERYINEQESIDVDTFGYDDEDFLVSMTTLDQIAEKIRMDELNTRNVNSVIEDEIDAGNYNEFIVFFRDWNYNEPEEAAPYTNRYYDALLAHAERSSEPSQELLTEAVAILEEQYFIDPEDDARLIRYARLLMESGYDVQEGANLLFALEENSEEGELGVSAMMAVARAHYLLENYEESIDRYEELVAKSSEDDEARIYYMLSQSHRQAGNETEARTVLEQAFEPSKNLLQAYGDPSFDFFYNFLDETN